MEDADHIGGGRRRGALSQRKLIAALVCLLVAVTWGEIGQNLLAQWRTYREAIDTLEANVLVDRLLQAGQNLAFERGRTNVVLRGAAAITPKDQDFLAVRRRAVDENLDQALSVLGRHGSIEGELSGGYGRLRELRARVDTAFALPRESRDPALVDEWFAFTSALVQSLGRDAAASALRMEVTSTFRIFSRFKIGAYNLRNVEGLQSSIIAAAVSAGKTLDMEDYHRVVRLRARSDAFWEALQNERQLVGTQAMDAQMDFIEAELFGRFRSLQDQVLMALHHNDPLPVPLTELTGRSVPVLDGVARLFEIATSETRGYAEANINRAWQALRLHAGLAFLAVVIGAAAIAVLLRGFFAPLRVLEGQLVALTAGDASITLPSIHHWSSEIQRMGKAVHAFRSALLERERIADQLADQVEALRCAEERALAANARLNLVLKNAADGIIGLDDENRVMFATPAAAAILGWPSAEAMQGRSSSAVFGHLLADGSPCTTGTCRIKVHGHLGEAIRVPDEFFTRQDGTVIPVEYVVSSLMVSEMAVGAVIVFHDILERRLAEQRIRNLLTKLQAIFNSTPIGLAIIDLDRRIREANPAFLQIIGRDAAATVGHSTRMLYSSDAQYEELGRRAYPVVRQGETYCDDVQMQRADGRGVWIRLASQLVDPDDPEQGVVWTFEDITERKAMEFELTRSNSELEQFAYIASHDLRQPLRMVASYLSLLSKQLKGQLTDEQGQFMQFAIDGSKRMDALILGLLDYSRIGRASEPTQVPLDEVIAEAVQNLSVAVREADASVVVAAGFPTVLADRMEMVRLFQNLIGNAVKYRAPDRQPRVEVQWNQKDGEWLLSIRDNGIGIAPEDCDRAFAIFQRLVSCDQYEGTGIGLAVCKKIVEKAGGRIWIESEAGAGSTFFFTLPLKHWPSQEASARDVRQGRFGCPC